MELTWVFLHPIKKEWIELGTHGSVQEALIASGELPDPFYGTNEEEFGWIEEHIWKFKSIFYVSNDMLKNEYVELEFPSLDTYADVYINDSIVLKTKNAFVPHRVQIKEFLNKGMNEVNISITPPVIFHENTKKEVGYELPAPNDVHETPIAPYVRKPQYQFGWDWALRMNTIGLNKPALIHEYDINRIVNNSVNILSVSDSLAEVEYLVELAIKENSDRYELGSTSFSEKSKALVENGMIRKKIFIDDPELWWPKGQGEPYLYEDKLTVYHNNTDRNELIIDDLTIKFGVRTSELIQEKDEWGTSYYFKINGRPIFCKGADYIPQEIFPAKVTDESIEDMIQNMVDANFNMVRVWGGGYYPDDVFFETCDEEGIMVWEDLMFACAMYPGDEEFLSNVKNEIEYQVPRIASHPSVVLFNGNNEVEVAWGNWGFQIKYGLYGESAKEIEKAYDDVFKRIAPEVIRKFSTIPYIHTSPLSNWGKSEFYNHGSQHYWGVWHGKDPIEDFGKKIGRFNAEYGFQSFPEYNTLNSFSEEIDWDLDSEVMKHHQKSYVGNKMILKHAKHLYGEPKTFEDFVYYSQLTQALAVSMAVAGHRLDYPRCGGTLYWQLNDCWPAPTWSSIDYFGNWKALHYRIKDDYRGATVLEKFNGLTDREYYFVSDAPENFIYTVTSKIVDFNGNVLSESESNIELANGQSVRLPVENYAKYEGKENYLLVFSFKTHEGELCSRSFTHVNKVYDIADQDDVSLSIEKLDKVDKIAVIKIETKSFLRNFWISSSAFGLKFNRNFIHLLPGANYITISYEDEPKLKDFKMKWM